VAMSSNPASGLTHELSTLGVSNAFIDICDELLTALPSSVKLEDDIWNIVEWMLSPGNSTVNNLYFSPIVNNELRLITKLWILDGRKKRAWNSSACQGYHRSIRPLDRVLCARSILTLKTSDFQQVERELAATYAIQTAFRRSGALQQFSKFLCRNFGLRLNYSSKLKNPIVHGRYGTEEGRYEKLIANEVLGDLLRSITNPGLSDKDRFYLSVFTIMLATGFRVTEVATLPAECMLRVDNGLHILHYPRKDGCPVPRPVHPCMTEVVEDAISNLLEMTKTARQAATDAVSGKAIDFSSITKNNEAFRYFVGRWANQWTAQPEHLMINPDGAWWNKGQCFVDVLGEVEKAGSKSQAARNLRMSRNTLNDLEEDQKAAQRGELPRVKNSKAKGAIRTSWDTDNRVLSFRQLEKQWGIELKTNARSVVKDIIEAAQAAQLQGTIYPAPPSEDAFEEKGILETVRAADVHGDIRSASINSKSTEDYSRPLLRDKNGRGFLYPHEALLVTEKYALSDAFTTRTGQFSTITSGQIMRWLCGESRSAGTGNAEDSVFSRLNITDSRTGEVAKFTSHDIRHWLNTVYQNGGLTEDQIALIFNRKYRNQNATYDQTSNKVRTERMKQAIRDGLAVGRVSETYNILCEFSREDAENYLSAVTRMVNPMPHGVCMLDWSTNPCPHHLSCFSCESDKPGPCEHLVIDSRNEDHVNEIRQMSKEANLIISAIELQGFNESPQIDHFRRIQSNTNAMLKRIDVIQLDGCADE
jgi:hypothetical protein